MGESWGGPRTGDRVLLVNASESSQNLSKIKPNQNQNPAKSKSNRNRIKANRILGNPGRNPDAILGNPNSIIGNPRELLGLPS